MKKFNSIKDFVYSVKNKEVDSNEEISIIGKIFYKQVGKVPSSPYTSVIIIDGNYNVYCILDSYRFENMFKAEFSNNLLGKFNEANSNLKIGKTVEIIGLAVISTSGDVCLDIKKTKMIKK